MTVFNSEFLVIRTNQPFSTVTNNPLQIHRTLKSLILLVNKWWNFLIEIACY